MPPIHVDVIIRHIADSSRSVFVQHMLVDADAEATWVSAEAMKTLGVQPEKKDRRIRAGDGTIVTRDIGYARVELDSEWHTVDEIIFGEDGDAPRLGARTLSGLGVRVDPETEQLVPAGPSPAATIPVTSETSN